MAQRLFQHDAGLRGVQFTGRELFADGGEQAGRGGQVHHHGVGLAFSQARLERGIVLGFGKVHAHIAEQGGKAGEFFGLGSLVAFDLLEFGLNGLPVLRVAQVVAAHTDDAPALGQAAVTKCLEQSRHQLAPDQITGAAKKDKIESHGKWNCYQVTGKKSL